MELWAFWAFWEFWELWKLLPRTTLSTNSTCEQQDTIIRHSVQAVWALWTAFLQALRPLGFSLSYPFAQLQAICCLLAFVWWRRLGPAASLRLVFSEHHNALFIVFLDPPVYLV